MHALSTTEAINKPLEDTGMDDITIGAILALPPPTLQDTAKKRACTNSKHIDEDNAPEANSSACPPTPLLVQYATSPSLAPQSSRPSGMTWGSYSTRVCGKSAELVQTAC